jgi:hypothetical protein
VVLNNTVDHLVRRAAWVVPQEVWGWVVRSTTAVIMVVQVLWVGWAEVNSVEVREDLTVDLTVVAEALAGGRSPCYSSIAGPY